MPVAVLVPFGRHITLYCSLVAAALGVAALVGSASTATSAGASTAPTRSGLQLYVREIEPIRLAVNRLLNEADPILDAARGRQISPVEAARRMGLLEQRFAGYAVEIAAIRPHLRALRSIHAAYANTYVLEDAYLSALVSGLARRELGGLPTTQAVQRAAIISWRIGLMVLARGARVTLPADLQQAGRGEIAPSPGGS